MKLIDIISSEKIELLELICEYEMNDDFDEKCEILERLEMELTGTSELLHSDLLNDWLESHGDYEMAFRQGQDIILFNDVYFRIDGYGNLQNITIDRLKALFDDCKNEFITNLKDEISYEIDELLEIDYDESSVLHFNDKRIEYNGLNYSIIDSKNNILYTTENNNDDRLLDIIIANLKLEVKTNE